MPDPIIKQNEIKKLELEYGVLEDAKAQNVSFTEKLGQLEIDAGFDPQSEAGLALDPFERQLAAHDLAVNGQATLVEDFFKTSSSKILFPEFIDRQVKLGMNSGKFDLRLEDVYTASQKISSGAATQISLDFDKEKVRARKTAEGSTFAQVTIAAKDKTIKLSKVGIEANFSYEALRRMQVIKASILFQRIGYILRKDILKQALKVMVDGDGNNGSASPTGTTAVAGVWDYTDLVSMLFKFINGHEATHMVMPPDMLQKIMTDIANFPQFQSPGILEQFARTGEIVDPFGRTMRTHSDLTANSVTMYEKDTCLELYEETGGRITESEKIIDKQFEKSVISYVFGFGKMFDSASYHQTQAV